jgi:hypothetical protein
MADYYQWDTVEVPLLEEVAAAERENREARLYDVADELELGDPRAWDTIRRLRADGLIDGMFVETMRQPRPPMACVRLTGRGARAVGLWPSSDPTQAMLSALDRMVASAPDSERTKLAVLREALVDVGTGVVTQLVSRAASGML